MPMSLLQRLHVIDHILLRHRALVVLVDGIEMRADERHRAFFRFFLGQHAVLVLVGDVEVLVGDLGLLGQAAMAALCVDASGEDAL